MLVYGELRYAQLHVSSSDVVSPSALGLIFFNSTDDRPKIRTSVGIDPIVLNTDLVAHTGDPTGAHAASAISVTPAGNLASTDGQSALEELQTDVDTRALDADLTAHITSSTAHTAANLVNVPSGNLVATDIQAALNELQTELDTATAHISDPSAAHAASAISVTPVGNLSATDVQAALEEHQNDIDGLAPIALQDHLDDAVDAHDASAISVVPAGNLTSIEVQAGLEELQTDVDTRATTAQLTAHAALTTGVHGVAGDLVGTTDAQVLTNKTMDGSLNTFSNIPTGALAETFIKADGSQALTGNWAAGAFSATFNSVVVGSAANTLSGVTTLAHAGGTLTLPSITDTLTTADLIQTFRNKSLALSDNTISMLQVGSPTYTSLKNAFTILGAAGVFTGGVISDAGGGTIDVSAGTGMIRTTNSEVGELRFFDFSAVSGTAIPADTTRYVGVEYNAGSPQVVVRTTYNWNYNDDFELGVVVNEGGTLHIFNSPQETNNVGAALHRRLEDVEGILRSDGLIISETGTRNIAVTAGHMWRALVEFTISAIDTSGADTFDRYYRDGVGGWTKQSAQTQWDNANYDDGTGVLASLTPNRYSTQYFYVESDGNLVSLYGQAEYTSLALAQDDPAPASLPDRLDAHAILIGRVIFQDGAGSASLVESVFSTTFAATLVTDHGSLAGLADDDHAQYALLAGRAGGQTLIGGTASGNNLVLRSNTSNDGEVEIEDALRLDLAGGTQDYVFSQTDTVDTDALVLRGKNSGSAAILSLFSEDGDQTDNNAIRVYGQGTPGAALRNWLHLGYYTTRGAYSIKPYAQGGSGQKALYLGPSNNAEQMILDTGGRVGIGTNSPDGKLHVKGDDDEITLALDADAAQTANIQEWRDSAETTFSYVDSSGQSFWPKVGTDELAEKTGSAGINVTSLLRVNHEFTRPADNEATTGNIDALDTTAKSTIRFTGAGAVTLRGIDDGVDGKIVSIMNVTGNELTVSNQHATPAAADRIITGTGSDLVLQDGAAAVFQYDATTARWRMISGAGGGGALEVTGTRGSPQSIVAGTGVSFTGSQARQMWFIQGSGGAVDITANPQIAAGSIVGQELWLICTSDTNTVKFDDGNGLSLKGSFTMGDDDLLKLFWDGTNWIESGRNA